MTKLDSMLNAMEERAKFEARYDRMIKNLEEIQDDMTDHDSIDEGFMHQSIEQVKEYLEYKKVGLCGA